MSYRNIISLMPKSLSLDLDAQAFLTAASITDATIISAINTLVVDLKSYGIWTKMKAIYPFVGGTASTHKFNLKDPRDLNSAFRLSFFGGWTHSLNGALPNGFNTYANTFLIPGSHLPLNSTHFSFYSRTNANTNTAEMGMDNGTGRIVMNLWWSNNVSYTDQYNFISNRVFQAQPNSLGLYTTNRFDTNTLKYFKNDVQMSTTNINPANPNSNTLNLSIYIGNVNTSGNPSPANYSTKEVSFFTMGNGLTDSEVVNLYNSVQTLQTTLGRQV